MRLFNLFVGLLLLLMVSTAAAKQEKTWICHVGNEVGMYGEIYDPDCVPSELNEYFCPDAGKIDLIEVAKASKHLDNPSHFWGGLSDYQPGHLGASGEGKEDTDGDGIDDGCEFFDDDCPCFDGITWTTPYEAYGLGATALCPEGSPVESQFTLTDNFEFGDFTVTVGSWGDCEGNIGYYCEGGPAGYFELTADLYDDCRQGPPWPASNLD